MEEIREFRRANGLTQDELAAYIGTGKAFISQVENGRSALPEAKFSMILNNPKGWDVSMLRKPQSATSDQQTQKGIPLIPIEAMAGVLSGNSTQVMERECEHYNIPIFNGAEFLIRISGDSMLPKYYSGDIVACKRLPIDTFFQWNRVYVVDSEQGVIIKRVRPGHDDQHVVLVSENEAYAPFELPLEKVYSIALVIGVVRAE